MKKFLLIILAILIAVPAVMYFFMPATLYSMTLNRERKRAGLELRTIKADGHTFPYLEGGRDNAETILLLHGFASEKDHWVRFAKYMKGYHVIIPDLPGFGDNSRIMEQSYDVSVQVDRIKKFLDMIGVKKCHIAGNSMGGNICALFAARYPDMTASVVLVDTGGVIEPVESELRKELKKGINPLVARNEKEYDRLMKFVFVRPPFIPGPIKKILSDRAVQNGSFNEKVFSDIVKKPATLTPEILGTIKAPVLVIWGDCDRILHISSVSVLKKGIQNCTVRVLENCGHSPMLERPEDTAEIFLEFYAGFKQE